MEPAVVPVHAPEPMVPSVQLALLSTRRVRGAPETLVATTSAVSRNGSRKRGAAGMGSLLKWRSARRVYYGCRDVHAVASLNYVSAPFATQTAECPPR